MASDRQNKLPVEISGTNIEHYLAGLFPPASFVAEQYRRLCHQVEQLRGKDGVPVLAVSSPVTGDGKTTTAIHLSSVLAQASKAKVLLVNCDLRFPAIENYLRLQVAGSRGLTDFISNPDLTLKDVLWRCAQFNLSILPSGRCEQEPYALLKSPRLADLLKEARREYEYIVVDTPPIVLVPDCQQIDAWVDAFIVVVAAHKTPRKMLEEALNSLNPEKILGLIFNRDDSPLSDYSRYYRSYYRALSSLAARST